jgi:hypothetical protein
MLIRELPFFFLDVILSNLLLLRISKFERFVSSSVQLLSDYHSRNFEFSNSAGSALTLAAPLSGVRTEGQ